MRSCPSQGLAFQPDVTFRYFFCKSKKIGKGLIMAEHCICFLPMVPFPFAGNAMARPWATRSGFKPSALPCNFGAHVLGRTHRHPPYLSVQLGQLMVDCSWQVAQVGFKKSLGKVLRAQPVKMAALFSYVSLGMPGD